MCSSRQGLPCPARISASGMRSGSVVRPNHETRRPTADGSGASHRCVHCALPADHWTCEHANARPDLATRACPAAGPAPAHPAPAGSTGRTEIAEMSTPSLARGFTMLELMVALTIAALLLPVGLPSFTTFLRNARSARPPSRSATACALARSEATRLNRPVSFTLAGGGDPSWTINIFNPATGSAAAAADPAVLEIRGRAQHDGGDHARECRRGHVQRPGPRRLPVARSPRRISSRSTSARSSAGEARTLRIYVDDLHGIRMCDPDPALAALVPPDARAC